MPVDTSSYGVVPTTNPMDAFSRAFAGAQQARAQQEAQRALIEERKAQTAEIARKTAEAQRTAFEEDTLTKLFGSGQPIDPKSVYSVVGPKRGADILKGISALQEQDIKTETALKTHIGTLVGGIEAMPAGLQPAAYAHVRESLIQRGLVKPDEIPEQFAPEYVAAAKKWALTPKEQFDQEAQAARDKIAATKAAAELPGITADAAVKQQVAAGTKGGLTPEQQRAAQDREASTRIAGGQLAVSRGNLELAKRKFESTIGSGLDDQGRPLPPEEQVRLAQADPVAKMIAEYRTPALSARSMQTPGGQALMKRVAEINPDYDASQFPARSKMRIAFTSGPQGQTLNSLNTAIEHLDQFVGFAREMGNGPFQPTNELRNWVKTKLGDTAPTNFAGITTVLSGEVAAALKKSGATDTEIANVERSMHGFNSTPQLIDYATKVLIPALGSKAKTFDDQWTSTMGAKDKTFSAYTPGAKQVLSKYGVIGGGDPTTPAPALHKVGDTVVGPDGKPHKVLEVSPDGKQYRLAGG